MIGVSFLWGFWGFSGTDPRRGKAAGLAAWAAKLCVGVIHHRVAIASTADERLKAWAFPDFGGGLLDFLAVTANATDADTAAPQPGDDLAADVLGYGRRHG